MDGTNVLIDVNDPAVVRAPAAPSEEQIATLEAEERMQKLDGPTGLLSTEQLKQFRSLSREQLAELQKENRLGRSKKAQFGSTFPDMGAAALARRDWKMGTEGAEGTFVHHNSQHTERCHAANRQSSCVDMSVALRDRLCAARGRAVRRNGRAFDHGEPRSYFYGSGALA